MTYLHIGVPLRNPFLSFAYPRVEKVAHEAQRWSTDTKNRLPPMWPGFDSGLFSCSKRLLPGYSGFRLSQKPKFELICCVLVKQLCLTEYIETYYHY